MTNQKSKRSVLLLIAIILTVISIIIPIVLIIALNFNIGGAKEVFSSVLNMIYPGIDVQSYVTMTNFDLVLSALLNVYFAVCYIKIYKLNLSSRSYSRVIINQSIWQMFIASLVAGIFALIAGIRMSKTAPSTTKIVSDAGNTISGYKFEAMKEAITRLNELKNRGAISEEEYYANLNKILEG